MSYRPVTEPEAWSKPALYFVHNFSPFSSLQFCLTLCDPVDCSTPDCHYFIQSTQQYPVVWVCCPISPAKNLRVIKAKTCPELQNKEHRDSRLFLLWQTGSRQMSEGISSSVYPEKDKEWVSRQWVFCLKKKALFWSSLNRSHQRPGPWKIFSRALWNSKKESKST